jgi:hypothetical protein
MRGGLGLAGEQPGALQDDIHSEFAPRQLRRIALRDHADSVAVHHHGIPVDVHLAAESAVDGVEARQMRVGLGVAQIIDRGDLDPARVLSLVQRPQSIAANAPITVDAYLDCHCWSPVSRI